MGRKIASEQSDIFEDVFRGEQPPISLEEAQSTDVPHPNGTGEYIPLMDVLQMSVVVLKVSDNTKHRLIAKKIDKIWQLVSRTSVSLEAPVLHPEQYLEVERSLRRIELACNTVFAPDLYTALATSFEDNTVPDPPP